MRPAMSVFLYEGDERFFGEGPYRLLVKIEQKGSLRSAAMELGMSYSKAFGLLRKAEKVLGFPLTEKTIGGKGGGGSQLTKDAKEFLKKYEAYREACYAENHRIYCEIFLGEQ